MKTIKNIVVVITLLMFSISSKAQIIIPVEDYLSYPNDIPDGAYIKDVNGVLNKFEGIWKGTYNNKDYEFRIVKYTDSYLMIREDLLKMRYKITDSNGAVIENTLDISDNSDDKRLIVALGYIVPSGGYTFYPYIGRDSACGQKGWVHTSVYGANNDKLRLYLSVHLEFTTFITCKTGQLAEQVLPTEEIILNKQ